MTARSFVKKIDTYSTAFLFRGILKHLAVGVFKQTGTPTIKKHNLVPINV